MTNCRFPGEGYDEKTLEVEIAKLSASTREDSKLKILTVNEYCAEEAESGVKACFEALADHEARHKIKG